MTPRKKRKWMTRSEAFVLSGDCAFWKAHGCNYLMSDYSQGIWAPVFPEIYDSKKIFTEEEILKRLEVKFWDGDVVSEEAKPAVAWALTTPNNLWKFVRQIKRGVPPNDLKKPYCAKVWKTFDKMRETLRRKYD